MTRRGVRGQSYMGLFFSRPVFCVISAPCVPAWGSFRDARDAPDASFLRRSGESAMTRRKRRRIPKDLRGIWPRHAPTVLHAKGLSAC
jgi:hypothetical protein